MAMRKRLKISKGGQVSVPAEVRYRWGTSTVIAEDEGERLVLRPAPDDPIDAVMGIFAPAASAMTTDEAFRLYREEEREAEERKSGR